MWNIVYFLGFFSSFILAVILTPVSGKIARKFNVIDIPSPRKVHRVPTPLLGGLGIFFSILLTVSAGVFLVKMDIIFPQLKIYSSGILSCLHNLFLILSIGFLVVIFGIFDDAYQLKPFTKLFLQIFVSIVLFFSGIRISLFIHNSLISFIITTGWIVFMMNSFNLLDNMDGLSSGVALISGFILFVFSFQMGQLFVATLLSVFLGAVAGFFVYNFPPAKIFMGECGSSFLGFFLGTITIVITFYKYNVSETFLPFFAPLVIFAVPFFDTLSVIWIRKKRKLPIFKADKNHLSHRLVNLGMSEKQAVIFIYLLTFCTGLGAILMKNLNIWGCMVVLIQVIIILSIVGILELTGRKNGRVNNIS